MKPGIWLLPSKGRPSQLQDFFTAAVATGLSTPGFVILTISDYAENQSFYDAMQLPYGWSFYFTNADGAAAKPQDFLNREGLDFEWIGGLSDDHVPVTQGWDRALISGVRGWNLVCSNDEWQAPNRIQSASVISGDLLRAIGYLAPPGMNHLFQDDFFEDLNRTTNFATWKMDIVIRHNHASLRNAYDETSKSVNSFWDHDKAVYEKWRLEDRERCLRSILSLQESKGVPVVRPDLTGVSVMLASLPYDGCYERVFMRSMTDTLIGIRQLGGEAVLAEMPYCADVALARARLFGTFLRSNHTHMMMIDSDMGWNPLDVVRLIDGGFQFSGAAGIKKTEVKQFAASMDDDGFGELSFEPDDLGFMEVSKLGGAFVLLTRACAEKMAESFQFLAFDLDSKTTEYAVFDPVVLPGRKRLSEDFAFCWRWRSIGGKIHILPSIRLKHIGKNCWEGALSDVFKYDEAKKVA